MSPPLHADLQPLAFLLGEWSGEGTGSYPTIEDFTYREVLTFGHVGKPFMAYSQRTVHGDTGQPLHAEQGYLRPVGADAVEFVVVQPSGVVELHEGTIDTTTVRLRSSSVHTTPTAKTVESVERLFDVQNERLSAEVHMGAVGQAHQFHLRSFLHKT